MRKITVSIVVLVAIAILAPATYADFANPGFEQGSFNGWTLGGGTWEEYPANSGKVSYAPIAGGPGKSAIVSGMNTMDSLTNNNLHEVLTGNYAARVNNYDNNYHYSTLSQTVTWNQDNLYFGWAAVLQEPSNQHSDAAAPNFSLKVMDITKGTMLYQEKFDVYHPPTISGFQWSNGHSDGNGTWKYSNWVVVHMDTSGVKGDQLALTMSAYDCGWGGHGGYAYLDEFSPTRPIPNLGVTTALVDLNPTPEPGTLSLLALGGLALIRRRRASVGM